MKVWLVGAMLFVSACTVENPLFIGAGDGGGLDDAAADDLSAPADLTPLGCIEGERRCAPVDQVSEVCQAGAFVADRHCATGTTCAAGFCLKPTSGGVGTLGQPCNVPGGFGNGPSENQCPGGMPQNSCQPFVGGGSVIEWVCGRPVGPGIPGSKCTQGGDCRSGFCAAGYCFRACSNSFDCPRLGAGNLPLSCQPAEIVVEGQKVSANSCTPQ